MIGRRSWSRDVSDQMFPKAMAVQAKNRWSYLVAKATHAGANRLLGYNEPVCRSVPITPPQHAVFVRLLCTYLNFRSFITPSSAGGGPGRVCVCACACEAEAPAFWPFVAAGIAGGGIAEGAGWLFEFV